MRQKPIVLLTTGGTVDKDYGAGRGIVDVHIGSSYFDWALHAFAPQLRYRHQELCRKDSTELTSDDRGMIVTACELAFEHGAAGVIISHGTDTLLDTAEALAVRSIGNRGPVVLTGALRFGVMKDTDADFQIGLALGVCRCRSSGIWVAVNDVYRSEECEKDPTTGRFVPK